MTQQQNRVIESITLAAIRRERGAQVREETDQAAVGDYAAKMQDGEDFPALLVFRDEVGVNWLSQGFTRLAAAEKAGLTEFPCEVRPGGLREAIYHALGSNNRHGRAMTPADRNREIDLLLDDAEWSKMSTHAMRTLLGIHQKVIDRRKAERGIGQGPDAKVVGVDGKEYKARLGPRDQGSTGKPDGPAGPLTAAQLREREDVPEDERGDDWEPSTTEPGPSDTFTPPAEVELPAPAEPPAILPMPPAPRAGKPATVPMVPAVKTEPPKDCLGLPILSDDAREAFYLRVVFAEAETHGKLFRGLVQKLATSKGGEAYRQRLRLEIQSGQERFHCPDLENSLRELQHAQPYVATCPYCYTGFSKNQKSCTCCHGRPYVTKEQWERAPEELRQAVLDDARGDRRVAA